MNFLPNSLFACAGAFGVIASEAKQSNLAPPIWIASSLRASQ
jgi:hypothetical protein